MLDFIVKYWLQFALGLIAAGLTGFVRHYKNLWKQAEERQKEKEANQIKEELIEYGKQLAAQKEEISVEADKKLNAAINEVREQNDRLLKAVLDVQRKQFKNDCERLLEEDKDITFDEFDGLQLEYEVYKPLGGNGPGHNLFELVKDKYSFQKIHADNG